MKYPTLIRRTPGRGHPVLLALTLSFAAVLTTLAADSAGPPPEALSPSAVNRWVEVMVTNHPALRAAQSRARAASLNADGVRRFADPKFMVGGSLFSAKGQDPSEDGNLIYGIEQPLPLLGKEAAARALARAEADTEAARAEARYQELRRDLAVSLFQAALTRQAVELTSVDRLWLAETVRTLESSLSTGRSTQVEVLRVQTELARRQVELETLRTRETEALSTVNRQLGRDPLTALPGFNLPGLADPVPYSESLVKLALDAEPRLLVLRKERLAAGAVVEATRRSQRPDLAVGVDGRQYGGDGGFREGTFFLSINVPLWNRDKYRKDLSRDRERLKAVEDEHADSSLGVREEIHHLTLRISTARREALLFQDDILPRAESTLDAALAQWSAGRGELRDVLESRRFISEIRLQHERAIAEQWIALSELVLCCGLGDLEALIMLPQAGAESPTGRATGSNISSDSTPTQP